MCQLYAEDQNPRESSMHNDTANVILGVAPKKKRGNPNYRNGVALERKLIKELRSKGLEGLRTAGSHGVADVVAYLPSALLEGNQALTAHQMVELVRDGWGKAVEGKVLEPFLYGGVRVSKDGKVEESIHLTPVLAVMIQCKRRKR